MYLVKLNKVLRFMKKIKQIDNLNYIFTINPKTSK